MPSSGLFSVNDWSPDQWVSAFESSDFEMAAPGSRGAILLSFFEPSTRTSVSFHKAALDQGFSVATFEAEASSLNKGESLEDSFEVFDQYGFRAFVVRHSDADFVKALSETLKTPVINAGAGTEEHPTQAAGDALCLYEREPQKKWRVVFFGDCQNSRSFRSETRLFRALGWEVAACSPTGIPFDDVPSVKREEMKQFDVIHCLRTQTERGSTQSFEALRLSDLGSNALLMHAGPVIYGQEIEKETVVAAADRSLIRQQVSACYRFRKYLMNSIGEG